MTSKHQVAEASGQYLVEASGQTVPVGYKQTEIGLIPVDWEVYRLGDKVSFIGSGKTNTKSIGEYPLYGSTGLIGSCKKPEYEGEAILVARVGANAGKLNFVSGEYGVSDNTVLVKLKPENSIQYYKYWLIRKNLNNLVFGSGQPLITGTQIKELLIPLPPENEQTAIANALSDVDALINALEKLIAKKQAIKTAAMQQLLTGRTRLPPFALREDGTQKGYKQSELREIPEDWDVALLGDIGQCLIGLTYSPNDVADFGALVLRSSNVQGNRLAFEDNVYVQMDLPERVIVKNGDILVCVRNGSRQLIGKCALIDAKAEGSAFGAFMSVFRTQFYGFVFYQLQSDIIQNQINEIMGATINQITNKDMGSFKIPLPKLEEEQTAIATILSDIDTDIQTLQQRLTKTRQIKQGMMQELLTGRIRLISGKLTVENG